MKGGKHGEVSEAMQAGQWEAPGHLSGKPSSLSRVHCAWVRACVGAVSTRGVIRPAVCCPASLHGG